MKLNRPMSPHLTQYAPTLPAMTSVAQRATGVILVFYAFSLSTSALFLPCGIESVVTIIQSLNLGTLTIIVLKFLLGAPFCFHYFNALRYIVWNTAKMLDLKMVYSSAYKAMGAALTLAVVLAIL